MKTIFLLSALLFFTGVNTVVVAGNAAMNSVGENKTSSTVDATMSSGEVKKIDKDAGKITIKHGPLSNLGMPAMTMVFRLQDAAMLDQVKVGDNINFIAEKTNGAITVTKIKTAKE